MTQPAVVPKFTPPVSRPDSSRGTAPLPADVVDEQVKRVSLLAGVSAFMWAFGLFMEGVVFREAFGAIVSPAALAVEAAVVVLMLAIFVLVRYVSWTPRKKADAGLWLMMVNALGTTALESWIQGPQMNAMGMPSWTTVNILACAMIMPNSPRKTLIASTIAAALWPLGIWVAHLRGFAVPTLAQTMLMALPNFLWAGVATLPAAMFQRMGRRIDEARRMGSHELVAQLGAGGHGIGVAGAPSSARARCGHQTCQA